MKLSDFEYDLPPDLIAQHPAERRDLSRLMVVDRASGKIEHSQFSELPSFLRPDDLLVLNNTKVLPARLFGRKADTGARIEVLLLTEQKTHVWEALVRPARRLRPGSRIVFEEGTLEAVVEEGTSPEKRILAFTVRGDFLESLGRVGHIPLPPYIRRPSAEWESVDRERYQTVYARTARSVAAPTAGLHFTRGLLQKLNFCEVTLHVGYGTFKPVTVEEVEAHQMDAEFFTIEESSAKQIQEQIEANRRVIAVGTTATRTLEHVAQRAGRIDSQSGWTNLYIYPGFQFRAIGGLITNFHLPGSTLLLLVSAFAGRELVRRAYEEAVAERYRFYSYGDAMLIL
ncbi:MAG: tRNA preQ1(34) S-adenosylmethionine ribosyltransferase-isomerase QueA [Acidobacteriota bacterium]|nr:MAG: tRNA preQ1(34) S-adenosylmethionine ribosyltransferase-isomerase QueA [Acidobacteriota bacterium]